MNSKKNLSFSIFVLIVFASGCAQTPRYAKSPEDANTSQSSVSRADPGYIQYLEKQSMLGNTSELARVVSGSEIAWSNAGTPPNPAGLLRLGSAWLRVHPQTILGPGARSPFDQLASPIAWSSILKGNITAIYIAPTGASGSLWDSANSTSKSVRNGEDVIQYTFAAGTGKDEDYRKILSVASKQQNQAGHGMVGGDLVPSATGLGPDFFLAARALREYPGIYCMMEVPTDLWSSMPQSANEWEVKALDEKQISSLASKKIIPAGMIQDYVTFMPKSGWAITGEVRGVDGALRRWVYRYFDNPRRPVLNWEDPSASAKRIISGSAIKQIGMSGNALIGYRITPWLGLDAAIQAPSDNIWNNFMNFAEPAMGASDSISREIRRYGAWAWLRDEAPIPFLNQAMLKGPDFVQDSILSPGAEHALLTGDVSLLRFMIDEAVSSKMDFSRLVHTGTGHDGVAYTLNHLEWLIQATDTPPEKKEFASGLMQKINSQLKSKITEGGEDNSLLHNTTLYATPAGIAALALGFYAPDDIKRDDFEKIARGHNLLVSFKAMQPGIFMPSGQDIAGTLQLIWKTAADSPAEWDKRMSAMGCYPLLSSYESTMVNPQGIPKARSIYPPMDVQVHQENSLLNNLGKLLELRREINLAEANTVGRLKGNSPGFIALVHKLSGSNSYVITVANFSQTSISEQAECRDLPGLAQAMNLHSPKDLTSNISIEHIGSSLQMTIPAWTCSLIFVGAR